MGPWALSGTATLLLFGAVMVGGFGCGGIADGAKNLSSNGGSDLGGASGANNGGGGSDLGGAGGGIGGANNGGGGDGGGTACEAFAGGGRWGTVWDQARAGRCPADCVQMADQIASEVSPGYCTAVIRFDARSLQHKGHAFVCSPTSAPITTEVEARAAAAKFTQFSEFSPYADPANLGEMLLSGAPVWHFNQSPIDFGGVVAVSAATGLTVFGARHVWTMPSSILSPTDWKTTDIGVGCRAANLSDLSIRDVVPNRSGYTDKTPGLHAMQSVLPEVWQVMGGGTSPEIAIFAYLPNDSVYQARDKDVEFIVFISGSTAGG